MNFYRVKTHKQLIPNVLDGTSAYSESPLETRTRCSYPFDMEDLVSGCVYPISSTQLDSRNEGHTLNIPGSGWVAYTHWCYKYEVRRC